MTLPHERELGNLQHLSELGVMELMLRTMPLSNTLVPRLTQGLRLNSLKLYSQPCQRIPQRCCHHQVGDLKCALPFPFGVRG